MILPKLRSREMNFQGYRIDGVIISCKKFWQVLRLSGRKCANRPQVYGNTQLISLCTKKTYFFEETSGCWVVWSVIIFSHIYRDDKLKRSYYSFLKRKVGKTRSASGMSFLPRITIRPAESHIHRKVTNACRRWSIYCPSFARFFALRICLRCLGCPALTKATNTSAQPRPIKCRKQTWPKQTGTLAFGTNTSVWRKGRMNYPNR